VAGTVGEFIAEMRRRRSWTQAQLAERACLSRNFIADLESGRSRNPSVDSIGNLARAFGIGVEEFFDPGSRVGTSGGERAATDAPPKALLQFLGEAEFENRVAEIAVACGLGENEVDERLRVLLRSLPPRPDDPLGRSDYRATLAFVASLLAR